MTDRFSLLKLCSGMVSIIFVTRLLNRHTQLELRKMLLWHGLILLMVRGKKTDKPVLTPSDNGVWEGEEDNRFKVKS